MIRIARTAGALYLVLVALSLVTWGIFRAQLSYAMDHPTGGADVRWVTWLIINVEVLAVVVQVLVAVWFFRLFRRLVDVVPALILAFGVGNALVLLAITGYRFWGFADITDYLDHTSPLTGTVLFSAGGILSSLCLIAVGTCVWTSGRMSRALGATVIAVSVIYLLDTTLSWVDLSLPLLGDLPISLSLVSDVWLIGYLLTRGIRVDGPAEPAAVGER